MNFFGPKHTGELAVAISVPTVITVVVLAFFSLPHLGEAWHNLKPFSGGFWHGWSGFVAIVLAVSGVEAIANATSVMKLDPGSSEERPSVKRTSTPAIFSVVLEVSIFTAPLGLGMHALGGLEIDHGRLIVATIVPAILVVVVKDIAGLAELYAIGVVGAIATNLGATSTDRKLHLAWWERALMFCTFLLMAAIEITLLIEKPGARLFAGSVVAVGLVLHGISVVSKHRHPAVPKPEIERAAVGPPHFELPEGTTYGSPMLCAVRGVGATLDFAIEIAKT